MKVFRNALVAAALVMGIASAAQAADMVRKVDSIDLLAEQSGKFLLDPVCAVKLIRLHQRLAPFPLTLLVRLLL